MAEHIDYDEFGFFHENAAEFALPYDRPPAVRRIWVEVAAGRQLSGLLWGSDEPELVLIHGGSQNAHTWDTVALALDRPLIALDLPGHGHSDRPRTGRRGQVSPRANAEDLAVAVRELAPRAAAVVGMSLGGLTTIALTGVAPELVRKVVLVDVTPGVTRDKAKLISDFVNGPPSFASFDEILERTIRFNPGRSVSSLRRGILHNAVQREDGTWVWRWARWRDESGAESEAGEATPGSGGGPSLAADLWPLVDRIEVPVMLARGMLAQSVVRDEDEQELLRRLPEASIVRFDQAGHSIQGDMPLELARAIEAFVFG